MGIERMLRGAGVNGESFIRFFRAAACMACGLLAAFHPSEALAQTPSFILIPPGPSQGSDYVQSLSSDGTTVVGFTGADRAFGWNQTRGRLDVGLAPGAPFSSLALGSSDNGAVIVGTGGSTQNNRKAFRYTNGVYQPLQTPASYVRSSAAGVSGDGSLIVGSVIPTPGFPVPAVWNAADTLRELDFALPNAFGGYLSGVSRDGSTAFGVSEGGTGNVHDAATWSPTRGWTILPAVPGAGVNYDAIPRGCNANGTIVVGSVLPSAAPEVAAIWRNGTAAELPPFGPEWGMGAGSVSDDGRVVIGAGSDGRQRVLSIWLNGGSPITFVNYLSLNGITIPSGWTLDDLGGMSGDGMTFTGVVRSSTGSQSFVATVPLPASSLGLIFAGILGATRRRRGVR